MKIFNFKSRFDTEYEIVFEKASYMTNDSLAIEVHCKEKGDEWWETYGTLTVNLGMNFGPNVAYLDTNNVPDLCDYVLDKGWAQIIGEGHSGFCTYPLAEFTDEFLEMCEVAE